MMCNFICIQIDVNFILSHLRALHRNDSVEISRRIIKKANWDRLWARRDPCPFRLRINVKDVSLTSEDWLFAARDTSCNIKETSTSLESIKHIKSHSSNERARKENCTWEESSSSSGEGKIRKRTDEKSSNFPEKNSFILALECGNVLKGCTGFGGMENVSRVDERNLISANVATARTEPEAIWLNKIACWNVNGRCYEQIKLFFVRLFFLAGVFFTR